MLDQFAKRLARLGPVGTVLTATVGGAVGFLVESGSAEAAAQVLATALASKGIWGGALAAGLLAGLGKVVAQAQPPAE